MTFSSLTDRQAVNLKVGQIAVRSRLQTILSSLNLKNLAVSFITKTFLRPNEIFFLHLPFVSSGISSGQIGVTLLKLNEQTWMALNVKS